MEKVLFNAKVYVEKGDYRQAVLIEDDLIKAVGSDEKILSMSKAEAEVIDCKGRTLIPGLNDSHLHFMQFGETRNQAVIEDAESIEEMIDICRRFAEEHPDSVGMVCMQLVGIRTILLMAAGYRIGMISIR